MVCRLNPIGPDLDFSLSTLVDEGVIVKITSCCKGQFERPIMIGMSCQEIIVAPGEANRAGIYPLNCSYMVTGLYIVSVKRTHLSSKLKF